MDSQRIWVSDWGTYIIPKELLSTTKLKKNGWPDKRSPKGAAKMFAWVAEMDAKERAKAGIA